MNVELTAMKWFRRRSIRAKILIALVTLTALMLTTYAFFGFV